MAKAIYNLDFGEEFKLGDFAVVAPQRPAPEPPTPRPDPEPEPPRPEPRPVPWTFAVPTRSECIFFDDFSTWPAGRIANDQGPMFDAHGGPWAQHYVRGNSDRQSAHIEVFGGVSCIRFHSEDDGFDDVYKNQLKAWLFKDRRAIRSGTMRFGYVIHRPTDWRVAGQNGPRTGDIGNNEIRISEQGNSQGGGILGALSVNNKNTGGELRDANSLPIPSGQWNKVEMLFDINQDPGLIEVSLNDKSVFRWLGRTCRDVTHFQFGHTAIDKRNMPLDSRFAAVWVR